MKIPGPGPVGIENLLHFPDGDVTMLKHRISSPWSVVLLALLTVAGPLAGQETPSPAGHWEGEIQVPGQGLGINVDLMEEGGAWTGDISIPVQATEDFPLGEIGVDGPQVTFAMVGVPGNPKFEGTVSEDGQTLSGTFSQGGQSFPFVLNRG